MGQNSKIEWTHHTFNPWRGCTKVSAGCANCYAERQSLRNPKVLGIWGDEGNRVIAAESYWQQPLKWNTAAKAAGERHRVFCASLADIFEDRPELLEPRCRLYDLIADTPSLDWLLLTKRPENFKRLIPRDWGRAPRENVWLGVSVEDQKNADLRIQPLMEFPARVKFLSAEPLLGRIVLPEEFLLPDFADDDPRHTKRWVIVGGESGPKARPMHPDWARQLRDDCDPLGVPFHFKQWGEWLPYDMDAQPPFWSSSADGSIIDGHIFPDTLSDGDEVDGWLSGDLAGDDLQVVYRKVGKKAAGRLLDGREWNEFPGSSSEASTPEAVEKS